MICTLCNQKEAARSWCVECRRSYMKNYRLNHREHLDETNKKWRNERREYIAMYRDKRFRTPFGRCVTLTRAARKRAKKRNLPYDLDYEFIYEMWEKQNGVCAMTGIPFNIENKVKRKAQPFAPSIDRIDPSLGYIRENVRLICYVVNCCLHDFGEEIFCALARNLVEGKAKVPHLAVLNDPTMDQIYAGSFSGTVTALHHSAMKHAKQRSLPCTITKNFVASMLGHGTCSVTGVKFDFRMLGRKKANPFRPSIDRIDSNVGYIPTNVRLVCVAVNFALNEFGEGVFQQICECYLRRLPVGKG